MSTFDYTKATKSVTDHAVKGARLELTYAGLVTHFGLTSDSDSATITDAARTIVLDGAHSGDTQIGQSLTVADLTGRDPGADAKHRVYWKAARTVRIGLVAAIDKGESGDPVVNLLTRDGKAATLEDVTRAWHAAQNA